MAYYTLAPQGREWAAGRAAAPKAGLKVLRELSAAISENDVPRTEVQIARSLGYQPADVEKAFAYLIRSGYVETAKLPQPKEKLQTPKPRIRPIEEIVKSELRAEEARKRYDQSDKGIQAHIRYELSPKGVAKNQRYWKERGKLVQKAFRLRRNIQGMQAVNAPKHLIDQEQKALADVEAQLKQEE